MSKKRTKPGTWGDGNVLYPGVVGGGDIDGAVCVDNVVAFGTFLKIGRFLKFSNYAYNVCYMWYYAVGWGVQVLV